MTFKHYYSWYNEPDGLRMRMYAYLQPFTLHLHSTIISLPLLEFIITLPLLLSQKWPCRPPFSFMNTLKHLGV